MSSNLLSKFVFVLLIGSVAACQLIVDADLSISVMASSIFIYIYVCGKASLAPSKNIALLFASLLFLVLFAYRIMFDVVIVQAYIDSDFDRRKFVVCYGSSLVQLFMVGAISCVLFSSKIQSVKYSVGLKKSRYVSLNYLVFVAWVPLLANLLLYIVFFRGRPYVDVHIYSHGFLGFILKSTYLTFGALILMAVGNYDVNIAFRRAMLVFIFCIVLYGGLLKLRSPLLFCALLLLYFYGSRISTKKLVIGVFVLMIGLASVGILRDPESVQGEVTVDLLSSLLALGEFADSLRYAIDMNSTADNLWGSGIFGSFFGYSEPIANTYARAISEDYFDAGGGFGFFVLADLVVNFGMLGAMLVMFVLGVVLIKLNYSSGLISGYIFTPVLFASIFGIVRNDLGSTFRGVVYTLLAVFVVRYAWYIFVTPKVNITQRNAQERLQ